MGVFRPTTVFSKEDLGGEEFGYPPSPRGDTLEPSDPDLDLLYSAAGHVRAVGVRL